MKIALSSYSFNWAVGLPGFPVEHPMTVFDLLDRTVELKVHVLQVVDNIPFEQISAQEQDRFIGRAHQSGIELEFGIRGLHENHLQECIPLAAKMKSKVLRIVVDKGEYHPSEQEIIRKVKDVVPMLVSSGVKLAIENTERFKAKTYVRLIEAIGSDHVGICLDTANNFGIGEGIETVVKTLCPYTLDLHCKDYTIHRLPHMMGFTLEGCPSGQGQLDIPWLLDELGKCKCNPNAVLELWVSPESNMKDTISKEELWVAQSIDYLRKLIPD
jgi:3-oxoisoapionate decarboxylase